MTAREQDRAHLSRSERSALQLEMIELLAKFGGDQGVLGDKLGVTQQAVSKGVRHGQIGLLIKDRVLALTGRSLRELLEKHGLSDRDDADPYPSRPPTIRWAIEALRAPAQVVPRLRAHAPVGGDPGGIYWGDLARVYKREEELALERAKGGRKKKAAEPSPPAPSSGTVKLRLASVDGGAKRPPVKWDLWDSVSRKFASSAIAGRLRHGANRDMDIGAAIFGYGAEGSDETEPPGREFNEAWLQVRVYRWLDVHPPGKRGRNWDKYLELAEALFNELNAPSVPDRESEDRRAGDADEPNPPPTKA
jgi:hypothetical protein